MGAGFAGAFQHTGAHALARHFHQSETADAAHLNARAVSFQRFFHLAFNGAIIAVLIHIDEVNDQQAGEVAQASLPRHFNRCFKICRQSGFLYRLLAGRFARVHVNRNQCFGRVDDQIAARWQNHNRVKHGSQLVFHPMLFEQGRVARMLLDLARMARHQQLHVIFGFFITVRAINHDLVEFF